MEETRRSLLWSGMLLFLLGLLTGLVEQKLSNPRMGLAAHLEGLMNGTFLLVLGAIWGYVKLSSRLSAGVHWSALYGTFANWAVTMMAAIFGTLSQTPITGTRSGGQPWQEAIVSVGFVSVALAMLACVILILWGLRPNALSLNAKSGLSNNGTSDLHTFAVSPFRTAFSEYVRSTPTHNPCSSQPKDES